MTTSVKVENRSRVYRDLEIANHKSSKVSCRELSYHENLGVVISLLIATLRRS